jgi:AcrR family transcriptional regulator
VQGVGGGKTPASQTDRLDTKRQRVLEFARRQFMLAGYADTGIEQIARDAKVSTATLYDLFPGKTQLFHAVIEDAGADFSRRIAEVTARGEDLLARLKSFASAYAQFMSDPFVRAVFRLVAAERRRFAPVAQGFYDRGRADFGGVLIGILAGLRNEGRIDAPKLATAAGQLMGMIEHPTFLIPMVTGGEIECARSPDQIAGDAVETFLARYGTGKA